MAVALPGLSEELPTNETFGTKVGADAVQLLRTRLQLEPEVSIIFADLFERHAGRETPDGPLVVTAATCLPLFASSGRTRAELERIWDISCQRQAGVLSKPEFFCALRLISLLQNKLLISTKTFLSAEVPAPKLNPVEIRVLSSQGSPSPSATAASVASPAPAASPPPDEESAADKLEQRRRQLELREQEAERRLQERIEQRRIAAEARDAERAVRRKQAEEELLRVQEAERLALEERRKQPQIHADLEKQRRERLAKEEMEQEQAALEEERQRHREHVARAQLLRQENRSFRDLRIPDANKISVWDISPPKRAQYLKFFTAADQDGDGFVSGAEAMSFFSKSKLAKPVLARVWRIADTDQDNRLDRIEFVIMMHVVFKVQDDGFECPSILPDALAQLAQAWKAQQQQQK